MYAFNVTVVSNTEREKDLRLVSYSIWGIVPAISYVLLYILSSEANTNLQLEREVKSLSRVRLFATPWTVAYQAPPYMGLSSQARVLEWVAISFSRGSSWLRDRTLVSHIVGGFFTVWTMSVTITI